MQFNISECVNAIVSDSTALNANISNHSNSQNMANDDCTQDETISVSVRIRLNNTLMNVDNSSDKQTYVSSESKQSVKTRLKQTISYFIIGFIEIMKQKSKQICLILALIITLFAIIHSGFVSFSLY